MNEKPKSGPEIVKEFFEGLKNVSGVEKEVAECLTNLYRDGKLTDTNLVNELMRIREEMLNEA